MARKGRPRETPKTARNFTAIDCWRKPERFSYHMVSNCCWQLGWATNCKNKTKTKTKRKQENGIGSTWTVEDLQEARGRAVLPGAWPDARAEQRLGPRGGPFWPEDAGWGGTVLRGLPGLAAPVLGTYLGQSSVSRQRESWVEQEWGSGVPLGFEICSSVS